MFVLLFSTGLRLVELRQQFSLGETAERDHNVEEPGVKNLGRLPITKRNATRYVSVDGYFPIFARPAASTRIAEIPPVELVRDVISVAATSGARRVRLLKRFSKAFTVSSVVSPPWSFSAFICA